MAESVCSCSLLSSQLAKSSTPLSSTEEEPAEGDVGLVVGEAIGNLFPTNRLLVFEAVLPLQLRKFLVGADLRNIGRDETLLLPFSALAFPCFKVGMHVDTLTGARADPDFPALGTGINFGGLRLIVKLQTFQSQGKMYLEMEVQNL